MAESDIGRALRQIRLARGLTQEDFAPVSGRTYIGALERGQKSPTLNKLAELALVLNVHPLTLLSLAFVDGANLQGLTTLQARIEHEIATLLAR